MGQHWNWIKNLMCFLGLHRWAQLNLEPLFPEQKEVWYCRWCSDLKIGGVIYGERGGLA